MVDFSHVDEGHAEGENTMVFHYNRVDRIAHAPKIVQDYYSGKMKIGRQGIFKSLVATRGNRFMFFSVVMCAAAMMFMWHFGPRKDQTTVHQVPVQLTAFSYLDTVYTDLALGDATKKYDESAPVPVSVEFSFFNTDGQVVQTEKISAKYDGTAKKLATTFTDYDILEVRVAGTIAEDAVALSAKVGRR